MTTSLRKLVCVIFDLNGTLLNTDAIVHDVLKAYLVNFGKQWEGKRAHTTVGKTLYEAATAIVQDYKLSITTDELLSSYLQYFPRNGAASRLNLVPTGGDEVTCLKPSPELYLEAAKKLKVDSSNCLVIEDSLPGVAAGKAAGMEVVGVASLPKQSHLFTSANEVINSLLDLLPENWGLPAFDDCYSNLLSEHPPGVYFGWAGLANRGVYKMVTSIGWNPYFNNTEKTIEPWLLHDFKEDFYGEDLHLAIVGYIRPEANFTLLESLIAKIHEDGEIAEKAPSTPPVFQIQG